MFEYLMPQLIMPSYANTLLDQTCKASVLRQIEYGRQRARPGAFPSLATMPPTCTKSTNIGRSAYQGLVSNVGWEKTWSSHPTPVHWR